MGHRVGNFWELNTKKVRLFFLAFTNKQLGAEIMKWIYIRKKLGWQHLKKNLVVTPFPLNSDSKGKVRLGKDLRQKMEPFQGDDKPHIMDILRVLCPLPPDHETGLVQSLYGCLSLASYLVGRRNRYKVVCKVCPTTLAYTLESVQAAIKETYPFMMDKDWTNPDHAAEEGDAWEDQDALPTSVYSMAWEVATA